MQFAWSVDPIFEEKKEKKYIKTLSVEIFTQHAKC